MMYNTDLTACCSQIVQVMSESVTVTNVIGIYFSGGSTAVLTESTAVTKLRVFFIGGFTAMLLP